MTEIDQLYRSQRNLHKLIQNRGYIGNLRIVPKSVIQEHVSNYGLEILDTHVVDKDRQLFVRYINFNDRDAKSLLKTIQFIHEMYNIQRTDDIILVNCFDQKSVKCLTKVDKSNHEKLLKLESTTHDNVRILKLKHLQFDIVSNIMVPLHTITSDNEIRELKKQHALRSLNQLPVILYSDPICRYYGFRSNMVIKIQRKTGIIYRLVVKIDTGISKSYTVDISPNPVTAMALQQPVDVEEKADEEKADEEKADEEKADEEKADEEASFKEKYPVRIGKKRPRGVKGAKDPKTTGYKNIDATSGSVIKIGGQRAKEAFSPMYLEANEFGAKLFENYWQYSKVFRELGHLDDDNNVTDKWHQFRDKGFAKDTGDRHPTGTKSKEVIGKDDKGRNRYRYYTPEFAVYNGTRMDYLTSRKKIYAPKYAELVKKQLAFSELKKKVVTGGKYQILDLDGPTDSPSHLVTVDLLKHKINDTTSPFGHGYVLAGLLSGIEPHEYCME
jgi:DNA-directed RNA polymerase subunit H (RpoH/RPB5)